MSVAEMRMLRLTSEVTKEDRDECVKKKKIGMALIVNKMSDALRARHKEREIGSCKNGDGNERQKKKKKEEE